jgi:type II secretory pathway pseudopilin PulG
MKAGTLVETLVSMTLLVIIISSSFAVLIAISGSTLNRVKVLAGYVIKARLTNDYYNSDIDTLQNTFGGFEIVEELLPRNEDSTLKTLKIEAVTPEGKVIYSAKRVVFIDKR